MTKSASSAARSGDRPAAIEQVAADWLARKNGELSPVEEAEFRQWLSANPRHAAAFAEFQGTWAAIKDPRLTEKVMCELGVRDRRRSRRRFFYSVGVAGLAAAAIAMMVLPGRGSLLAGHLPRTVVLRPDVKTLPDGSTVELKAGAEIAVEFTPERRVVRLFDGGAFFTVAKDKLHPFVVITGSVEVTAVGTAFSVCAEPEKVAVVVTEGTVAVERTATPSRSRALEPVHPESIYVSAGKATVVVANPSETAHLAVISLTSSQSAAELAWRGKRFEFNGTPLASAVEIFNRQNRVQLSIADAAISQRRITGIFWTDDPDGFVRLLEKGLDVKTVRLNDSIVLSSR